MVFGCASQPAIADGDGVDARPTDVPPPIDSDVGVGDARRAATHRLWRPCLREGLALASDAPLIDCGWPTPFLDSDVAPLDRERILDFDALNRACCHEFNQDLAQRWALDAAGAASYLELFRILGIPRGRLTVGWSARGTPSYLTELACEDLGAGDLASDIALAWLRRHDALMGLRSADIELEVSHVVVHSQSEVVIVEERIRGLRVLPSTVALVVADGSVRQTNGFLASDDGVASAAPAIDGDAAVLIARDSERALPTSVSAELIVYDLAVTFASGATRLAWHVTGGGAGCDVDALTGAVLRCWDGIKS